MSPNWFANCEMLFRQKLGFVSVATTDNNISNQTADCYKSKSDVRKVGDKDTFGARLLAFSVGIGKCRTVSPFFNEGVLDSSTSTSSFRIRYGSLSGSCTTFIDNNRGFVVLGNCIRFRKGFSNFVGCTNRCTIDCELLTIFQSERCNVSNGSYFSIFGNLFVGQCLLSRL